jgi:trehalose 6-phosphate phosphatase
MPVPRARDWRPVRIRSRRRVDPILRALQTTGVTIHLSPPPPVDFDRDALFLDFDGTLVELADRPEGVLVTEQLIDSLHRLSERLSGRLALVSGRDIATLDGFGMENLAIAGSHGAEWRMTDGRQSGTARPEGMDEARAAVIALADAREGVLFEDKPLGAALHYRMARDEQDNSHALANELAARWGFHVQHGHQMVELRRTGVNKGSAIAALMQETPFVGHRPVFLGDDVTDEDGFAAVADMAGHGILVGLPRDTAAQFRLANVSSVNEWLASSLQA